MEVSAAFAIAVTIAAASASGRFGPPETPSRGLFPRTEPPPVAVVTVAGVTITAAVFVVTVADGGALEEAGIFDSRVGPPWTPSNPPPRACRGSTVVTSRDGEGAEAAPGRAEAGLLVLTSGDMDDREGIG